MGGRHQHFEDLMIWSRDIRKTKFHLLGFYLNTCFSVGNVHIVGQSAMSVYLEIADIADRLNSSSNLNTFERFLNTSVLTSRWWL